MIEPDQVAGGYELYVCPSCKGRLDIQADGLICQACHKYYPLDNGIPDFLAEEIRTSSDPLIQWVKKFDQNIGALAGIYESRWWYPLVINVYMGRNTTTFARLVELVKNGITVENGLVLDVACGPGTYGRRVASSSRTVYGIDLSMAMLHKGLEYANRDQTPDIHFSRNLAEALPFPAGIFDAAICCGSLHLFADPLAVLTEINRTMKSGAVLAVMTFFAGDKGLLRYQGLRDYIDKKRGLHAFKLPELEQDLSQAGFLDFKPLVFGSGIFFTARKAG